MTRLSQIIAVEKGVKSDAERKRNEAKAELGTPVRLSGISRTYQPRDEEGDQLPPESTRVQVKAGDVLSGLAASLTRLFDVTLTKDHANCTARADVVVDGKTLLPKVPVTYLLFLEKQLAELAQVAARLPLLDPSEDWSADAASGFWRTAPSKTVRSKKVPRNHQVAAATVQHPEQVQVYMEDVPAGDWTTVKFSGAMPATATAVIGDRIAALATAVKFAREEANTTEVTDQHAGSAVFGYLFG